MGFLNVEPVWNQEDFVFSRSQDILVPTYMEGAQRQLNEESYKFWESLNLVISDEREENLMNTQ